MDTSYEPDYTDPESIIKEPILLKEIATKDEGTFINLME